MTDPKRILETVATWRDLIARRQVVGNIGGSHDIAYTILATDSEVGDLAVLLSQVAKCLEVPGSRLATRLPSTTAEPFVIVDDDDV